MDNDGKTGYKEADVSEWVSIVWYLNRTCPRHQILRRYIHQPFLLFIIPLTYHFSSTKTNN